MIQVSDPGARSHSIENLTIGTRFFAATTFVQGDGDNARSYVASRTIA